MASLYETIFGFGIFGIISLIIAVIGLLYSLFRYRISILQFFTLTFNGLLSFFENFFKNNSPLIGADNCAIMPETGLPVSRVPSNYLAHIAFFFAFLFANAYAIYKLPDDSNTNSENYNNRINRTTMIMFMIVLLYTIIVVSRYMITGCESEFGILFTTILFGTLGYSFYKFGETCGVRPSDVLGISTSFVSSTAEAPVVCARS